MDVTLLEAHMCMREKKKELLLATKNKLMKIKDEKYWIGFKCFEQNDLHEYLILLTMPNFIDTHLQMFIVFSADIIF